MKLLERVLNPREIRRRLGLNQAQFWTQIGVTQSGEYPRWAMASALASLMIYQQPVRDEFGLIRPPALLVVGQQDRTVVLGQYAAPDVLKTMGKYPELARAAAHDIPKCTLAIIPQCGHIPHLEQPQAFYGILLRFLGASDKETIGNGKTDSR